MSSLNHNPIIKNIPLKDIKPYSNNPRKKQNITKVVNSIKEFGFQQPIVVDKKNIINSRFIYNSILLKKDLYLLFFFDSD